MDSDDKRDLEAAGKLVALCFHASTVTHFQHLSVNSYARHKALNEFYDDVLDRGDAIAETVASNDTIPTSAYLQQRFYFIADPIEFLEDLHERVEAVRYDVTKETHIQNIIDELVALIDRTLYKLRQLK